MRRPRSSAALFYSTHDHHRRVHPPVFDDRPGRRIVRSDGEHLCICDRGALLMSVTLAPVLCSFLFVNKKEAPDTWLDKIMKLRYLRASPGYSGIDGLTMAVMVSLFCWSLYLIPHLGAIFMPPFEEGYLWIRAILPRTVSREYAASMAPRLRELIGSVPEVDRVISQFGRPDDGTDPTSFFNLEFGAPLEADGTVAEEGRSPSSATSSGTRRSAARTWKPS